MSNIINIIPNEILDIIICNSENSICPFVCKRWNMICNKSKNYAKCTNIAKLISNNLHANFYPEFMSIDYNGNLLYIKNMINIPTLYFKKHNDILMCKNQYKFILDDQPICYDLKRFLNKIHKHFKSDVIPNIQTLDVIYDKSTKFMMRDIPCNRTNKEWKKCYNYGFIDDNRNDDDVIYSSLRYNIIPIIDELNELIPENSIIKLNLTLSHLTPITNKSFTIIFKLNEIEWMLPYSITSDNPILTILNKSQDNTFNEEIEEENKPYISQEKLLYIKQCKEKTLKDIKLCDKIVHYTIGITLIVSVFFFILNR